MPLRPLNSVPRAQKKQIVLPGTELNSGPPPSVDPCRHVNWDSCQPFFEQDHIVFSFTRRTGTSRPMCTSSAREASAKFWLEPVRLERSQGFGRAEIQRIERLVGDHAVELLRSWNEYFGD